jgi:hypothetical protein
MVAVWVTGRHINCSDDGRTAASGRYEVQAARFVDELVNAQDMSADFVRRLFVHVLFACQFRATMRYRALPNSAARRATGFISGCARRDAPVTNAGVPDGFA